MTINSTKSTPPQTRSGFWLFINNLPGARILRNLNIGRKLTLGFGILVIMTLAVAGFSYWGSIPATDNINRTGELRVPTALASASAQANLLRMLSDVRGYLALGQGTFRDSYNKTRQAFETNLDELKRMAPNLNPENQERLNQLEATFNQWSELPEQLFALRDDQLEREPAYRLLATDGSLLAGSVLIDTGSIIESQSQREATEANLALLGDMANFQGTFAAMFSALRGYTTTRNRIFRQEYEVNLAANEFAWQRLLDKSKDLDSNQQDKLNDIKQNRQDFLLLPAEIFELLEGERWREDLFLFSTQAVPLAEKMQVLLAEMTADQQALLQTDLNQGRAGLRIANRQTLTGGVVALILGVLLTIIFHENIAGPIRRLTNVAEQIREGDLEAQASIESSDEIGTLASTFNSMTTQLRQTLLQVRKEKKRADDLLNVVIPIGVELSSEKDFNRLLENMLVEAKSFCHANAGIVYLRTEEDNNLKFVIMRNDSQNIALGGTTGKDIPYPPLPLQDESGEPNHRNVATYAALSGKLVNIANTAATKEFDFSDLQYGDEKVSYQAATSMLTIPLENTQSEVLGVMQLLDAQDPDTKQVIPFDQNLQQMMESFSSLAVAALEAYIREQSLKQEIVQLRIEIDETKRQQQVSEIVDTDFFSDLKARAQEIRHRSRRSKRDKPTSSDTDS